MTGLPAATGILPTAERPETETHASGTHLEFARDDVFLDFGGAPADLGDLRVAVEPLDDNLRETV